MEFNGPSKIKVRRVARPGYFGISSYPKSVTTFGCELSKSGFKTGLTKEEEAYYEEKLGLKPGELNRHSKWWSDVFNTEVNIRLNNTKTTEIDLSDPMNQIRYKVMLASSKVANSEIEKTPESLFYIDNEEAKAKAELETFNYEFEGTGLIHKMAPEEKRSSLRLFGATGVDTLNETMLNAKLMYELKKDPKKFVDTLLDKDVKTKGLINELLEKGFLKRKGNYFIHGEDTIAASTDECVAFLNDPKNQSVRMILESRLTKNKKVK